MDRPRRHARASQLFYGLLIAVIGIVFLLDNLEIVEAHEVFRFWPVIIIVFGLFRIAGAVSPRGKLLGLFFIAVGILFLLDRLYIINVDFWDWWPLILVFVGINILMKRARPIAVPLQEISSDQPPTGDPDAIVDMTGFLSGNKRVCVSQEFRGGDLTAVLGGCELDLRKASIKNSPAVITIFAVLGGISIRVPQDWTVSLQGTPFLGGIDDKTHPVPGAEEKLLIIKGEVIMGGADITN